MKKKEYNYDQEVRTWLSSYRSQHEFSNKQIATQLGTNTTAVSKYLSGKPEGNINKLESLINDLKKAAEQQIDAESFLFETSIYRQLSFWCDMARAAGEFNILHSPAGLGKTCAIELYKQANPLCLDISLNQRNRDSAGLERLVFNRIEAKSWNHLSTDRWTFLVDRLRKSNRLILIDNAQRITKTGLKWLFDFHDDTGCPVCLVGNPEVLDLIDPDDQQWSRCDVYEELKLENPSEVAVRLTAQYLPEQADELTDLVTTVAEQRGHLRAVKKQVLLTREILKAGKIIEASAAFRAAHTKLIRHYQL